MSDVLFSKETIENLCLTIQEGNANDTDCVICIEAGRSELVSKNRVNIKGMF